MIQKFIIHKEHPRLLLFFAGWGMDEHPFLHYHPHGYDFMICYDYRTLNFNMSLLKPYKAIHTVAWSMGVWAASQVLANTPLPISNSVAINGTPYPIDKTRGILPAIFRGTLEGLNETSLLKFQRRMCGSAIAFNEFRQTAPQRPVEELKDELEAIGLQYGTQPPAHFRWQQVFIGSNDLIFPAHNQQVAWEGSSPLIHKENRAHYDKELFSLYLKESI